MRKNIAKSILSIVLAGALILGEAAPTMAASGSFDEMGQETYDVTYEEATEEVVDVTEEVTEEATEEVVDVTEEVTEEATEEVVDVTEEVTEEATEEVEEEIEEATEEVALSDLSTNTSLSFGSYVAPEQISFTGYATKVVLKVNGVQYDLFYNTNGNYASTGEPMIYYETFNISSIMRNGPKFECELIPYDQYGVQGASIKKTFQKKLPKVASYTIGLTTNTSQDGPLNRPQVNFYCNMSEGDFEGCFVQIYRATSKTGTYKLVEEHYAWDGGSHNTTVSDSKDLIAGKTYYYKLRLKSNYTDSYAPSYAYSSFSTIKAVKISKPSVQDVRVSYNGKVELTWDNYDCVHYVDIYRSTKKTSGFKKVGRTKGSSYIDTKAKAGARYYYKVKPIFYVQSTGKEVTGATSEVVSIMTEIGSLTNIRVKQASKTALNVSWDKVGGATQYKIYAKSSNIGDANRYIGTTSNTTYTIKGLEANKIYLITVYAYKGTKIFTYNTVNTGLRLGTGLDLKSKMAGYTISSTGKETVKTKLTWNRDFYAQGYYIRVYDRAKGEYRNIKTITSNATVSCTISNPEYDGYLRYSDVCVIAYDKNSSVSSVSVNPYEIPDVQNVKIKQIGAASYEVSCDKYTGDSNGYYVVYYKLKDQSYYSRSQSSSSNKVVIDSDYITPGESYDFIMGYYSYAGAHTSRITHLYDGNVKPMISLKATVAPTKITSATNSAAGTVTLKWTRNSKAKQYLVYRSTSKTSGYVKVATVSQKTTDTIAYKDTKLSKGKTYYYKIVVVQKSAYGKTLKSKASGIKSVKVSK